MPESWAIWCVGMAAAVVLYSYAGYPLLVWVLARWFGQAPQRRAISPRVSLVIPAYNEVRHLTAKLENALALDYPANRLEIVVASDGSTDGTNAIADSFRRHGVRVLAMRDHLGKAPMLNRVLPHLRGELVVFSDASSLLERDALYQLVQPFADPQVGCVSGGYRLTSSADVRSQGENLYWRYETFLKMQESRLHSILGAHGAFYAIRRSLFVRLEDAAINDDYLIPMRIVAQGYRAVYAPRARAWERELSSVKGDFARRRRIAAGNCQQMVRLRTLLHPRRGWVAFCFFSHKVLRTIAPIFLLLALLASGWLPRPWSQVLLGVQVVFYVSALAGYLCQRSGRVIRWLSPSLYFCLGNLAMLAGLVTYCAARRAPAWGRTS